MDNNEARQAIHKGNWPVRHLDHDYVNELIRRLASIPPDAIPAWGTMTAEGLVRHLTMTVRYSMGLSGKGDVHGNWFSRAVLGPLVIHGIVKIPKNVRLPKRVLTLQNSQEFADLETLHAVLENYLSLVQAGSLKTEPHPYFGHIGVDGWDKFHVRHFEHHLRQFSA